MAQIANGSRRFRRFLLLLAVLLAAVIGVGGWLYYRHLHSEALVKAGESLTAIAELKAMALENWVKERRGDVAIMRDSLMVRSILQDPTDAEKRQLTVSRFDVWMNAYGYGAIIVANSKGEILLKHPQDCPMPDAAITSQVQKILQSGERSVMDVARVGTDQTPYFRLAGLSYIDLQTNAPPDGVFMALVDLREFIYPFLKKWPLPSESAETVLVERIGDEVVLLNDLRRTTNLTAHVSINSPSEAPAVKMFRGDREMKAGEVVETVDIRGVEVLAEGRWIAGTPWLMVVKLDADEAFASLHKEAFQLGVTAAFILATLLLCIGLLWKQQEQAHVRTNEARFRTLIENAPVAISISRDARTIYTNQKFLELYGYQNVEELSDKPITEQWATESRPTVAGYAKKRARGETVPNQYEGMALRKDHSQFPVSVAVGRVELPDGPASIAFLTDITERKRAEQSVILFRKLIDHANDAIEVVDPKTRRFLDINAKASQIHGYSREEYLTLTVFDMDPKFANAGEAAWNAHLEALQKFGFLVIETEHRRKDGIIFPVEINLSYVRLERDYILAVVRDITERKQSEAALRASQEAIRESERRLRSALDSGEIGVWHQDERYGAFTADERLIELYALPIEDSGRVPFETWVERIHPEDRPAASVELESLWNGSIHAEVEFRVVRPDGVVRYMQGTGSAVSDNAGQVIRVIGANVDVTELKEAVAAREALVTELGERVKELQLLHQTARLLQREHASLKDLLHEWVLMFPPAWQHAECCEVRITYGDIEAATPGWRDTPWKMAVPILSEDGSGLIEVVYLEERKGTSEGPFLAEEKVLLNSLTEMLVAYLNLRRYRENLQSLVESRTRELNAAKEEAEKANRAKGLFLGSISHEIRTPMNAILGYAQLLENDAQLAAAPRKKASIIRSSGDHLLHLVNDVLEVSRIESGKVKLLADTFDFHRLLTEVRDMFLPLAGKKENELSFETAPEVPLALVGDPGKVRQVIINLLSNAVKFTEAGSIVVRTTAQRLGSGRWALKVSVTDSGKGIAADELERIFETFEQTDSGRRAGGTGLGLTISRNFARKMGGEVTVESTLGTGSTFHFMFEADEAADKGATSALSPVHNLRLEAAHLGCKVLIVDDVPTNRDVLAELLTKTGFEVRAAESGEEGIRLHDSWAPRLVLMDVRMEGMDGIEAIRRLRQQGSKAALIALTASSIPEARADVEKAGGDDFLMKPYRERELLESIGKWAGLRYEVADEVREEAFDATDSDLPLDFRALEQVPRALLEQLRGAALEARSEQIESLAQQVAEYSPALATYMLGLARNFQYDELLLVLDNSLTK